MIAVNLIHPQPSWQGAQVFVENYHPVQTYPFFGGIALVLGFVVLMAALYHLAGDNLKTRGLTALVLTAAFATLIFFNYINQTTFVPSLARNYRPDYEPLIAAFSFSNPDSLCWAIEMWGYGLLGVATWLVAPVFNRDRVEKIARILMIANGIISVIGALVSSYDLGWVFSAAGLACYVAWNIVVIALMLCIIASLRRRRAEATDSRPIPKAV